MAAVGALSQFDGVIPVEAGVTVMIRQRTPYRGSGSAGPTGTMRVGLMVVWLQ